MILFWLICAGLLAIALAFILPTLLQAAASEATGANEEANVEVYRDQLSELEADLANGIVSSEHYKEDRDAIERRLLADVAETPPQISKPFARASLKSWGLILIVVGACQFSVLLFGNRFRAITVLQQAEPTIGIVLLTLGGLFLVMRSNRSTAFGLALAMPILAGAIYLKVGDAKAVERIPAPPTADGQMTQQGIEANVAAMAKRLEQNPGDADGWAMLARSYLNLEKYAEASNAYAKAAAIKTDDADLLTEYAFALAMANGRQLQGQPAELVKKALQIDPENPKALQLAGTVEFDAKNYNQAIAHWQKLLAKTSGNPELVKAISKRIEEAKALAKSTAK
jgi:cytochrome c-type biogenesis protein CcmH